MFLNWIWQLNQLLTSMNEEMSSQITTFLVCLFTLCASVRLLSTVGEHMVLQNSISTNDFSHSEQGWGFSPVCISKCLPNVPALLNAFALCSSTVCPFPTVAKYVLHKFSSSCEWLFALCTSLGILSSVNEHMSALISSLAELLFAFCALVWFLSTEGEHVSDYVIAD